MGEEASKSSAADDFSIDDSVYIKDEDDTFEKVKSGLKKFGGKVKKGANEFAQGSKNIVDKSKEKITTSIQERKKLKAMRDPLSFPWSTLTVSELKEKLRELELKVSGKKDDLIERILEHYRTEIPSDEDGTPHLIDNLDPVDEPPVAEGLGDGLSEDEVSADGKESEDIALLSIDQPTAEGLESQKELVDEIVDEVTIPDGYELVPEEVEILVDSETDGAFIHSEPTHSPPPIRDKPKKTKKKNLNPVFTLVDLVVGFSALFIVFSIINSIYELNIFTGFLEWVSDALSFRIIRSYGGMTSSEELDLAQSVAFGFSIAALGFFGGRFPSASGFIVFLTLIVSLVTRGYFAYDEGLLSEPERATLLIYDAVLSIPLVIIAFMPAFTRMTRTSRVESDIFRVNLDPILEDKTAESFTDSGSPEVIEDENMSEFQVTRPKRPRRRGSMSFYEGLFLIISLISWPVTIGMHMILALEIATRYGNWNMSQNGILVLTPLYLFSIVTSFIVYHYDREAREGPIYAKEKVAYHEQMDQYLGIKKAYYEMQAAKLSPSSEES